MGKFVVNEIRIIKFLAFLFAIAICVDFEYNILTIAGDGEVLGQSNALVGDVLKKVYKVVVPLKLLDIWTLILGMVLIFKRASFFGKKYVGPVENKTKWLVRTMVLLQCIIIYSIAINHKYYTSSQLVIMLLHFIKIIQVVVTGILTGMLVSRNRIYVAIGPFSLGVIVASVALLLNNVGFIYLGAIAGDRMETFGALILVIIFLFLVYQTENMHIKMTCLKKLTYYAAVFFATIAILTSGKRGVELSCLITLAALLLSTKLDVIKRGAGLKFVAVIGVFLCLPNIYIDYNRSANLEYNAIYGTSYNSIIVDAYNTINPKKNDTISKSQDALVPVTSNEILIPIVSNLDYSGAERVGKLIKTVGLIFDNPFFGIGFYGVRYRYDFLPDSIFQVILECGAISFFLLLVIFIMIKWLIKMQEKNKTQHCSVIVQPITLCIISLSIFCNPLYMSRVVLMLVLTLTVLLYLSNKSLRLNHV